MPVNKPHDCMSGTYYRH